MVNMTELAMSNKVANFPDRRVVKESVIDKQSRSPRLAQADELPSFLHAERQRLFDPHMLARFDSFARQRKMRRQRRRQDDSRDVRVRENIVEGGRRRNIRVGLVDLGAMRRMDIADGFHQAFSAFNK